MNDEKSFLYKVKQQFSPLFLSLHWSVRGCVRGAVSSIVMRSRRREIEDASTFPICGRSVPERNERVAFLYRAKKKKKSEKERPPLAHLSQYV